MNRLLPILGLIAFVAITKGQGTLTFVNGVTTRVQMHDFQTGLTSTVPASLSLRFGVFVNGSPAPVLPLGSSSTTLPGNIEAPNGQSYAIPGTLPGQAVLVQIRGWAAEYGEDWQAAKGAGAVFGETDVRQVVLTVPPGIVIWQSLSNTRTNCFYPLVVSSGGITVADVTVAEGSNGVAAAVFTVKLGSPLEHVVAVGFSTQDGTALAGQDYVSTNGTLTFAPGETSKTIQVTLTADGPPESDELFSLILSDPVNSVLRKGTATCLITEARINDIRIDTAIVFHTVAGRRYAVEKTTDLVTWEALSGGENVLGIGGPMTVHDTGVGCAAGLRYYRTRLLTQ